MTTPNPCAEAERPKLTPRSNLTRNRKVPTKEGEEDSSSRVSKPHDKQQTVRKKKRRSSSTDPSKKGTGRRGDGFCAGLLAIGIYALMHDSGIMTILLLAFVWWYSLEESHQRIFLFFLVVLNFAEYFYLLPPVLARYQQEDWWDVPTIKTALLTMFIFWSIAWFSAATGSYLENKEQQQRLQREKQRLEQQALFQPQEQSASRDEDDSH